MIIFAIKSKTKIPKLEAERKLFMLSKKLSTSMKKNLVTSLKSVNTNGQNFLNERK